MATDGSVGRAVFQKMHHEYQEEVGALLGAVVQREILLIAIGHRATEGRIGEDDVHPVTLAVLAQGLVEGVPVGDVGQFHVVEDEVSRWLSGVPARRAAASSR